MRRTLKASRFGPFLPITILFGSISASILGGCGNDGDVSPPPAGDYSRDIQPIFTQNCVDGCHSPGVPLIDSRGLDLTSWEGMTRGANSGEVVIAFRPEDSHMISHLTGEVLPQMPLSLDPLPDAQIETIRAWILNGARNDAGEAPYEDIQRKIYVANQGSDEISILSLDDLLVTRILSVGDMPQLENPHNIWLDQPGERWYVTMITAGELWQYNAANDSFIAKVEVGASPANGVTSEDGSTVYVTNWNDSDQENGTVQIVDAATMTVTGTIQVGGKPHGIAISDDGTRLYTTNYYPDNVSVIDLTQDPPVELTRIPVAPDAGPLNPGRYLPNEVVISEDGRFLFIVLFGAAESDLRVLDLAGDSLYTVIPTGGRGFLADLTPDGSELWVADWSSRSVSVIDANTFQPVETLTDSTFSFPHGVAFTDDGRYALVTNENNTGDAPAHHCPDPANCNIGNVTIIDTVTREVVKTIDLEIQSAGIAVKF
jgi:YVTN family beta-propeller protein